MDMYSEHPRITLLINLGMFAAFLGDNRRSDSAREEAVARARQFGDGRGASHALIDLSQVARREGDFARAVALGEEGLLLARKVGHPFGIWRTHGMYGDVLRAFGDVPRALELYKESLGVARQLGGPWVIAQSLRRLGLAVREQGDLAQAIELLEEAAGLWASIDVRRGRHWAAMNLGQLSLQRGDLPRARRWFAESLPLCYQVDRNNLATSFAGAAATLAVAAGDESPAALSAAAQILGQFATLLTTLGRPMLPGERLHLDQAETAARAGLGDAAFEAARAEGVALSLDEAVEFAVAALTRAGSPA
jgi:tetratricopeptide (TPR) repeat protein